MRSLSRPLPTVRSAPRLRQRRCPAAEQHDSPVTELLTTARHQQHCRTCACDLPDGPCLPAVGALHACHYMNWSGKPCA